MAGRRRGRESVADMVRSLGLVLAVVVVVFLIARPSASNSQRVRTVDYGPDVARARAVAPYRVLAPVGRGAGGRSAGSLPGRLPARVLKAVLLVRGIPQPESTRGGPLCNPGHDRSATRP